MFRWLTACTSLLTLSSILAAQQELPAMRPRTIRTMRLMSDALGAVRTFGLLLPPDYDQSTRRYPVIYLLHGSGQQHSTWGRQALLANTADSIVVMPDMDRTRYMVDGNVVDPRAEAFIVHELVEYVDAHYRTLAARDGRAIGGLSIGGFGALVLGLRHPETFGTIGAFSAPADGVGNPAALLASAGATAPAIYLACGSADPLLASNRRFAALLTQQQIRHRYEEGPGGHTWESWDWQLRSFLTTLRWPG